MKGEEQDSQLIKGITALLGDNEPQRI
jgi:hypothetical protein